MRPMLTIAAALLLAALPAFGQPALCFDSDHEDDFTGEKDIGMTCVTPDAKHFLVMKCTPAKLEFLIGLQLIEPYRESPGDRIEVEFSIDKGRVHDFGHSILQDVPVQDIDPETVSRILNNLTGAHTLAFRSRLRGHGRVSAVFDLGVPKRRDSGIGPFHVGFARLMSACRPD